MPPITEVEITNGPTFRDILAHGPIGKSCTNLLTFQMRTSQDKRKICISSLTFDPKMEDKVVGTIINFGDAHLPDADKDDQTVVIHAEDDKHHHYFIVASYNTRTRKGFGLLLTADAFYACPFAHILSWKPPAASEWYGGKPAPEREIFFQ